MQDIRIFIPLLISIALTAESFYFMTIVALQKYRKYKTVSHMYNRPFARRRFKIGLILTGILQCWLAISLTLNGTSLGFEMGKILFSIGGIGSIIMGIFSLKENRPVHYLAAYIYFFGLAFAAVLLSTNIVVPSYFSTLLILVIFSWVILSIFQYHKRNYMFAVETLHILHSYVWIMLISVACIFYTR